MLVPVPQLTWFGLFSLEAAPGEWIISVLPKSPMCSTVLRHDWAFLVGTILWPPFALEIKYELVRLRVIWPPSPTSSTNPTRAGPEEATLCATHPDSRADRDDGTQPPSQHRVPAGSCGLDWPGGKDCHFPCWNREVRMGPQRNSPLPTSWSMKVTRAC